MSATAGLLVAAISKISPTRDATLPTSQQKRSSIITSDPSRAQVNGITELSCRISRSSSQQNLETDSGKSSCSPGLLDYSYENGTGVEANGAAPSGANTRGGLAEGTLREKRLCATNSNSEAAASDSMSTVSSIGIGTGISCNAEEEMRQKLRFDRLHKFRLILLALDRQRDPHRLLRERLSKIGERRIFRRGSKNENNCNVCSGQIKQVDSNSFVTCYSCNRRICRGANCSIWLAKSGQWECQLCNSSKESLAHTQSWVAEQMSFNHQKLVSPLRARSEIYIPIGDFNESSIHFESVSQVGMNLDVIPAEQKLKIREYVEEVVAKLLGGSLDQIRVNQLSKSETYLPSIINSNATPQSAAILNNSESNHNPNVSMPSEFSEISQMRLRQMIESIIAETLRMPPLNNGSVSEVALNMDTRSNGVTKSLPLGNGNAHFPHHHRTEHYFEPKIYQDLLATAVLNKIADKEGNIRQFSESTPDLSSCNIDSNFNVENQSTSSGSSVEPRSDFSYTDTEKSPKINKVPGRESVLSDYIAAHTVPLPDLSAAVTESEDDDHASISSSILAEGTWEDNWLFKKKRSSLTAASITGSVGMLVPAPKDDVRAQIGDKTTDEISDLSEMGSDTDDSSSKIICAKIDPLNDRILNKHLIGGQNTKVVLDELIETASMISNTSHSTLNEPKYTETRNEHVLEAASKVEALNPSIANSSAQETMLGYSEIERKQNPSPGSIAEREYKKWNNAVEMPNNPYAPEALKRRISGSQERFMDLPNIVPNTEKSPISLIKTDAADDSRSEIDYKRYSRDYYINDDKVSKTSPKHQIVATDGSRPSPNISDEPTADIAINEPIEPHSAMYEALPAQVVEENNASIETLSNQSMQSVNTTTTSDDSDTVRIYDFKNQQTTTLRNERKTPTAELITTKDSGEPTLQAAVTISTSIEDSPPNSPNAAEANSGGINTAIARTPITPTRGSTPMAFKFLQPKRKLIDPSKILSQDEGAADALPNSPPGEKAVVEEEVAQVMPSVKALAQAFLFSSNKYSPAEKRWKKGVHNMPSVSHTKPGVTKKTEASLSVVEIAEDATIASDLSSLETDPPTNKDLSNIASPDTLLSTSPSTISPPTEHATTNAEGNKSTTNALRRVSMLKINK
ncbi:uncharacterized protein LOC118743528 [Rhagoletis pomonella]|uniref:uncharacterized protein LOC118743528 n=1 Tax=Rhagoletis pomonella TaxID=28610 RepID=UPI00178471D6|nr:uncharacterized protein LOC118743528 [Rhagoletis pomonella]